MCCLIDKQAYAEDVEDTIMFLEGNGKALIDELVKRMETAAAELRFEKAARYRTRSPTCAASSPNKR